MVTNLTKKRMNEFLNALKSAGGSSGNVSLRQALNWDEDFYWKVQGHLIETGQISPGRGKGGSVRFLESETRAPTKGSDDALAPADIAKNERTLYKPLKEVIAEKWIQRFALDDAYVAETHSRGSKDTGGTFSRPDITAVGIRRYVYLPNRWEIIAFEVKSAETVSVLGVLEAIAHREASHRAYVLYATSRIEFEKKPEGDRILELAQKYGVGVVLVEVPADVETWEILIDAARHEPDPSRLDRFLVDLPSDEMKKQLSKWKA